MKRRSIVALSLILCAAAARAADVASLTSECDGCHGPHGASGNDDVPSIGGISSFVISDALLAYRDSARPCPASKYRYGDTSRAERDMCSVAKALEKDEVDAVAQDYATQPFVPAAQAADAAKAEAGRKLHEAHCEKCHTGGATRADDDASILGGQWMGYLRRTFEEYRGGKRDQPKNMKAKLDALTPEDFEALVQYYGSRK
jgi:sulfide dehydrogenase cytochrome subunit